MIRVTPEEYLKQFAVKVEKENEEGKVVYYIYQVNQGYEKELILILMLCIVAVAAIAIVALKK
jgi:hypothetical protein